MKIITFEDIKNLNILLFPLFLAKIWQNYYNRKKFFSKWYSLKNKVMI